MTRPIDIGILEHITLCENEWTVREMLDKWGRPMAHEILNLRSERERACKRCFGFCLECRDWEADCLCEDCKCGCVTPKGDEQT